jgi:hypothetical protein
MELVRNLPASAVAAELARPAVDLVVGRRLDPTVVDEVRTLAEELVSESAARASAHTIELAVVSDARSIHLEVRWAGAPLPQSVSPQAPASTQDGGALTTIHGLADRWGFTHRDGRHCLWVEKEVDEVRGAPAPGQGAIGP